MKRLAVLALCLSLLAPPQLALALFGVGDIVNDPLNLVQNTATALRSWISNANEALQLDNQIKSLYNETLQLAKLPLSIVEELHQGMATYNTILNTGKGLAYSVQASLGQFEALYNNPGNLGVVQRATMALNQLKNASLIATQAQSIFDLLCQQTTQVGTMLAASQASVGQLQATQATNQMLGILAAQNASLQEMSAATGRMQVAYYMRQATAEEQARSNAQLYLELAQPQDWASRPGRGQALPD